jgi:integrase
VRQKKTGGPVKFELTEQARQAIDSYLKVAGKKSGEFLFVGRRGAGRPMTKRRYASVTNNFHPITSSASASRSEGTWRPNAVARLHGYAHLGLCPDQQLERRSKNFRHFFAGKSNIGDDLTMSIAELR